MRPIDADALLKDIQGSIEECEKWIDKADEDVKPRAESAFVTFTECALRIKKAPMIELDEDIMQKFLNKRCMSIVTNEFLHELIANKKVLDNSFTIGELSAWLREIMINNSDNSLGDACIDIRDRLDGFVRFCKDRRAET